MESEFQSLECATASGEDLEARAELFASCVQISAATKVVPMLMDNAAAIERKWLRMGAYVLIILGAFAYVVGCMALPNIEDTLTSERTKQNR
jgi:hypothetical protein